MFWHVGSSAILGTTTAFAGNIVALTSITLNTGASVSGRVLARTGAVTRDTNSVTLCTANAVAQTIPTLSGRGATVLAGLIAVFGVLAVRRLAA